MENNLTLKINHNCSSMISSKGKNGRKLFLSEFTHFLNKKLFENGVNCKLVMKYNWFKSEISRKKNCYFWSGMYICKIGDCKIQYHAYIEMFTDFKSPFDITIKWNGNPDHQITSLKPLQPRISGLDRKSLGLELLANGITNTRNKIILEKDTSSRPISRNTLKQIKFEANHVDRISNDINIDTIASKRLYSYMCEQLTGNDHIKGFVHHHSTDPFGFLLMCQIQVI